MLILTAALAVFASAVSAEQLAVRATLDAAVQAGDAAACKKAVAQALRSGQLDEETLARAWVARGQCHAQAGELDFARRSYAVAVRVWPAVAGPDVDEGGAFAGARDDAKAAPALTGVGARSGGVITLRIEHDELSLCQGVVLWRGADEVARAPLSTAAPTHKISGAGDDALEVRFVDEFGNTLRTASLSPAPPPTTEPAPATTAATTLVQEPTWATWVGLAGVALGGVGFVVGAINYTGLPPELREEEGPLWLGVAGIGVVATLVGGVLVVLDPLVFAAPPAPAAAPPLASPPPAP